MKNKKKILKKLDNYDLLKDKEIQKLIQDLLDMSKDSKAIKIDRPTQNKLPNDWKNQIMDAKVAHDKYGVITLVFVLPLSWLDDFKTSAAKDGVYDAKNNSMWGADIMFGPIDSPVAASDMW